MRKHALSFKFVQCERVSCLAFPQGYVKLNQLRFVTLEVEWLMDPC